MILCYSNRSIYGVHPLRRVPASSPCLVVLRRNRQEPLRQKGKRVRYVIERMTMSDVPRVIEIERLAYPSTWPAGAYRKEFQDNLWAHYILLRDKHIADEQTAVEQDMEKARKNL